MIKVVALAIGALYLSGCVLEPIAPTAQGALSKRAQEALDKLNAPYQSAFARLTYHYEANIFYAARGADGQWGNSGEAVQTYSMSENGAKDVLLPFAGVAPASAEAMAFLEANGIRRKRALFSTNFKLLIHPNWPAYNGNVAVDVQAEEVIPLAGKLAKKLGAVQKLIQTEAMHTVVIETLPDPTKRTGGLGFLAGGFWIELVVTTSE